jgi:hypothetical protein
MNEQRAQASLNPQDYLNFLGETLQKISENTNPQVIYPFWAQNLDKLDDNLAQILDSRVRETLTQVTQEQAYYMARDIVISIKIENINPRFHKGFVGLDCIRLI